MEQYPSFRLLYQRFIVLLPHSPQNTTSNIFTLGLCSLSLLRVIRHDSGGGNVLLRVCVLADSMRAQTNSSRLVMPERLMWLETFWIGHVRCRRTVTPSNAVFMIAQSHKRSSDEHYYEYRV